MAALKLRICARLSTCPHLTPVNTKGNSKRGPELRTTAARRMARSSACIGRKAQRSRLAVRCCRHTSGHGRSRGYFSRRRVRFRVRRRFKLDRLSRFALAATCCRYRSTILSAEAPAIRFTPVSKAAWIFSATIRSASRRPFLPPSIKVIIRSATT
jgi:hypothetical protein